jgi:acyl carrier protein
MDDLNRRLVKCFRLVFPELPEPDIPAASPDSLHAWDSVATITLINVVEDEFGIEVDLDLLPELNSFARIREYIAAAGKEA